MLHPERVAHEGIQEPTVTVGMGMQLVPARLLQHVSARRYALP